MIPRPRHPILFLLALLVSFVMWYGISAERRETVSVRGAQAALTLVNLPRDMVLTSSVPETVALRLRGPRSLLAEARNLEVLLDLAGTQPGITSHPIDIEGIPLPPQVSVLSADPQEITLELERLANRRLPVRATIEGEPAPGFVVGSVEVLPDQMVIRGPGSRLARLDHVATTPVSIDGATESVETGVQAVLQDAQIRPLAAVPLLVIVEILPAEPIEPEP